MHVVITHRSGVGAASVEAFLLSLSRCCNGSITDKMGLAFQLYDNEGKGVLSPDAVRLPERL